MAVIQFQSLFTSNFSTMKKNKLYHVVVFIVLFIIGFIYLNKVFATQNHFNNTITGFEKLSNETNIDLIFYGSSHVYTAYNPLIFNNINKTISYNLGSDALKMYFTDLVFIESIKKARPKLVVLELYPASFSELKENEMDKGFQLRALDFSSNFSFKKLKKVIDVYNFNEIAGVYSPLIRNHSKWNKVDYFSLNRNEKIDTIENYFFSGFIGSRHFLDEKAKNEFINFDKIEYSKRQASALLPENKNQIIDFIKLVKKEGADILIISSPDLRAKLSFNESFFIELKEICNNLNIQFLNLNNYTKEIGLSLDDFKDYSHLNTYGSIKVSKFLAEYIKENYNLPDRSNDINWKKSAEKYIAFKEEYSLDNKEFYNVVNESLVDGVFLKNVKIEKTNYNICQFTIDFDVNENIKSLNNYKLAVHAYPIPGNEVYLADVNKKRNRKYDLIDIQLDKPDSIQFSFQTKIKEFKNIEFFLFNSRGFDGVIGNTVKIQPSAMKIE